jgi:two-component system, NarL family, nitrate/nitrite sensor histidine kinase NarX
VYSVTIGLLVILTFAVASMLIRQIRMNQKLRDNWSANEQQTHQTHQKLEQQLTAALKITRLFIEAREEQEIIETLLNLSLEITGAMGISFVPLDEHGKAIATVRRGDFPFPVPDAWLEYLASPTVRRDCAHCTTYEAHSQTCALLHGPFSDALGLYCFPLRYDQQDFGIMNIYLPAPMKLEGRTKAFLNSIVDATALALEGERLRQRELSTLSSFRNVREKQDIFVTLSGMIENLSKSFNGLGCLLVLDQSKTAPLHEMLEQNVALMFGEIPVAMMHSIDGYIKNDLPIFTTGVRNFQDEDQDLTYSCLNVPVVIPEQQKQGLLIVFGRKPADFSQRRIKLVQSVSDQLAILVRNADIMAGLEYRIVMDERARLSREIHDGLAQTLGFLKLQVAQMFNYLERNDLSRLKQAVKTTYDALSIAYQDARQAIDGLRVSPYGSEGFELKNWLNQTLEDFTESTFSVELDIEDITIQLPVEVHAQLIRIVQEALSNIRKHAQASKVWISFTQKPRDLILEIRDNGTGFTQEDIPNPSRFGLRGMRERAELLGADFQVISQPGGGTVVRVRLPLEERYWMEA